MTTTPTVLLAVATELAKTAQDSLPKIRNGETIRKEWFKNGVYYRETAYNDEVILAKYDFRQEKSRQTAVALVNKVD